MNIIPLDQSWRIAIRSHDVALQTIKGKSWRSAGSYATIQQAIDNLPTAALREDLHGGLALLNNIAENIRNLYFSQGEPMQIVSITDQMAEVTKIKPDARMNGTTKEKTVGFNVGFEYSSNILNMLAMDKQELRLEGLWDDEGKPRPGVESVKFSREFEGYTLTFSNNGRAMLTFNAEKLSNFNVKPKNDSMFDVDFRAFGVTSDGDTEKLHKMIKNPSITVSIAEGPHGVGDLTEAAEKEEESEAS